MNENLTWIADVLDESGSMNEIKTDTIGARNEFIREQRLVPGEASCTLIKFNTKIEKVYENLSIFQVPDLNENSFRPNNWTRLYDAIGYGITELKAKIKASPEDQKPGKVLFIITTDGKENRSTDYTRTQIFEMISKREKKGWKFIYLGANQNAMEEGGKIGVNKMNTVTWSADSKGINTAFKSAGVYASMYRSAPLGSNFSADLSEIYKEEERKV